MEMILEQDWIYLTMAVIGMFIGMFWLSADWYKTFGDVDRAPVWLGGVAGCLAGFIWFISIPAIVIGLLFKLIGRIVKKIFISVVERK